MAYLIPRPSSERRRERSLKLTLFKTPSTAKVKTVSFQMDTSYMDDADPCSFMKPVHTTCPLHHHYHHLSGYSYQGHHHIHLLQLDHPENHQWSPTQKTLSPTGRKRHKSEPAFIRPQDIDRWLTPRFSALLQETSPLAPYKQEKSAKARARQAFSTMYWTPFKTLREEKCNLLQIDSFQDPVHSYMGHNPFVLTPFKTPVIYHQIDSFQDPICLYTALNCSNWLLSRPQHSPSENYLQIDSVKSPWETSFNKIGYFKTISHSESWTHFKTPASCLNSVFILHGRLPSKK